MTGSSGPLQQSAIPLVHSAFDKLKQAEGLVADYLKKNCEFDAACGKVYRAAAPKDGQKMPHKDAISQLNYWFEAMKPILHSKGLLARLPEIQEAKMCITKERWKRDGMAEDDFTTFYYAVLKSVANYVDGSHVPTVSWDTEPGDIGLLNSEGNPVRDSPLYQRTKPKVAPVKWENETPAGASVARMLGTMKKGEEEEEEEEEDDDFDFGDFGDEDELEDFAAAQAVFNYMSLPSFDKRHEDSGSDDEGKVKSSKKPAPKPEVESEDEDAELHALARAGVRVEEDKEDAGDDDGPIHYDADGVSRNIQEKEVF